MVYRLFCFWHNLTNICKEIREIRMNLRMSYTSSWRALFSWNTWFEICPFALLPTTCNVKGLEEVENIGGRWRFLSCLAKFIKDLWLQPILEIKAISRWKVHNLWATTSKIDQYFWPVLGKRKRKLLFELEKEKIGELKSCQQLLE